MATRRFPSDAESEYCEGFLPILGWIKQCRAVRVIERAQRSCLLGPKEVLLLAFQFIFVIHLMDHYQFGVF